MEGFIKITATPDGDTGCHLSAQCDLKHVNDIDKAQLLRVFLRSLEMSRTEAAAHLALLPILETESKEDGAPTEKGAPAESSNPKEGSACHCGSTRRSTLNIGKYCIVHGEASGVFAGILSAHNGREVTMTDCRRLWFWDGAASISQIAAEGVTKPGNCKFTVPVNSLSVLDAIEIIPTTAEAEANIKAVPVWKM